MEVNFTSQQTTTITVKHFFGSEILLSADQLADLATGKYTVTVKVLGNPQVTFPTNAEAPTLNWFATATNSSSSTDTTNLVTKAELTNQLAGLATKSDLTKMITTDNISNYVSKGGHSIWVYRYTRQLPITNSWNSDVYGNLTTTQPIKSYTVDCSTTPWTVVFNNGLEMQIPDQPSDPTLYGVGSTPVYQSTFFVTSPLPLALVWLANKTTTLAFLKANPTLDASNWTSTIKVLNPLQNSSTYTWTNAKFGTGGSANQGQFLRVAYELGILTASDVESLGVAPFAFLNYTRGR